MNIFHKVTLQALRRNRVRTAVTVVGIILSAAMFSAVTTFAVSLRSYAIRDQIYSVGNWHGRVLGANYQTFLNVRESGKAEEAASFQQLGYAAVEGCQNRFKPYLYLLGADKITDGMMPVHLTCGRAPASPDEILLPDHLSANGGVTFSLGDQLTLALGQRVLGGEILTQQTPCFVPDENGEDRFNGETLEVRETRTYTVVGFYQRLDWQLEEISAPGYTAFTKADPAASPDYAYDVYFRMKHPGDLYDFMQENGLGSNTNRSLLMYTGTIRYESLTTVLYSMAAIAIGLIMFGSVALIYNAFSISVSERTKQFGLLSSVGATRKQLRSMVLFEAFSVSLIGIPVGILAGIGGIGITLLLIADKFRTVASGNVDLTLSVSPASVAVAAAVALITVLISAWIPSRRATRVSAVEAIRQNADITVREKRRKRKTSGEAGGTGKAGRSRDLTYVFFGLPGVLATRYYKRSRKKYRATVLSLFMSIVLFVSASAFTGYLTETVSGALSTAGYELEYEANPEVFDRITPDGLAEQIRAAKSVTGVTYARERYGLGAEIQPEYLTDEGQALIRRENGTGQNGGDAALQFSLHILFVDGDSFRALLRENGLQEETFTDPAHPLGLALDGITLFNRDTEKYETTTFYNRDHFSFQFRMTREIPGYALYSVERDEAGTAIYRYLKDGTDYEDGELLELTEEEASTPATLEVGKVITEKPNFLRNINGFWLIYPLGLASSVFENWDASSYSYYFTVRSDSHAESREAVRTVLRENGLSDAGLYDVAERQESDRNLITIVRVFSYGFIVLISLIAAANVFNTISTNISLRRREFAMLKSVGMTAKSFNRMMDFECLLYGSRALAFGLPVSCGITYLIYRSVMAGYETTFRLPWGAIGVAVLSVFLVVFVTMLYAMRKIKKDNPIDALKNENL